MSKELSPDNLETVKIKVVAKFQNFVIRLFCRCRRGLGFLMHQICF